MYIQNGIAYAGELEKPIKVCGVKPLDNFVLWLRFNTNEEKLFDFKTLLSTKAFEPLKSIELFKAVYIDYGCATWDNGNIDIAPEYLYENGTAVS